MVENNNTVVIFKFSEQRWIKRIVEGELSFSCAGAFIYQAQNSDNNVQGDLYEAVFAKLKNNDSKIEYYKRALGTDLEIIPFGEYTMLRRRSSKFKPIFCFYQCTAGDLIMENNVSAPGKKDLYLYFDKRLFDNFSVPVGCKVVRDEFRFTSMFIQPEKFVNRIKKAFEICGNKYKMQAIDYQTFKNDTFLIEPNDNYDELFYKFPNYAYQKEGRICVSDLSFHNINERWTLPVIPFFKGDYDIAHNNMYMKLSTIFQKS